MEKRIETFEAVSGNGRRYIIHILQEQIDASTLASRKAIPGMKRAILDNGSEVNPIDDESFQIVATGEIIHRVND